MMRVQHQVISRIKLPRQSIRLFPRYAARLPKEKMAIEIEGRAHDLQIHTGETCSWLRFLPARGIFAIHDQIRVVHELGATRPNFDRANVSGVFSTLAKK